MRLFPRTKSRITQGPSAYYLGIKERYKMQIDRKYHMAFQIRKTEVFLETSKMKSSICQPMSFEVHTFIHFEFLEKIFQTCVHEIENRNVQVICVHICVGGLLMLFRKKERHYKYTTAVSIVGSLNNRSHSNQSTLLVLIDFYLV